MRTINTIGERIRFIMKRQKLTQAKFAEQLHLSQQFVSMVCNGTTNASDRTISDICRLFNVSEAWLRDGIGEMFVTRTMNQELAMMANALMSESDDSFRKVCVTALLEMPPEFWHHLQDFVEKLSNQYSAKKED